MVHTDTGGKNRKKKGGGRRGEKKKNAKELNSAAVPYPRRSNPWAPQRRPSPLPSKPPPQEQEAAKSKPVLYLPFRDAGAVIGGSKSVQETENCTRKSIPTLRTSTLVSTRSLVSLFLLSSLDGKTSTTKRITVIKDLLTRVDGWGSHLDSMNRPTHTHTHTHTHTSASIDENFNWLHQFVDELIDYWTQWWVSVG